MMVIEPSSSSVIGLVYKFGRFTFSVSLCWQWSFCSKCWRNRFDSLYYYALFTINYKAIDHFLYKLQQEENSIIGVITMFKDLL